MTGRGEDARGRRLDKGGEEHEGSGWLSLVKDRDVEQGKRYLYRWSHYRVSKTIKFLI